MSVPESESSPTSFGRFRATTTNHDRFLALALAAEHTDRVSFSIPDAASPDAVAPSIEHLRGD